MQSDREIAHNRPGIHVLDLKLKRAEIIDVAVPLDDNARRTFGEKVRKYQHLAVELKELYRLEVVPFIISVNGLVPKSAVEAVDRLGLEKRIIEVAQQGVILDTARIVRKVLGVQ